MRFGKYSFQVSNRDKVFFPSNGITKGDLIDYYIKISDVMIPHLKDRPLSMQRFPDGIGEEGFYQKELPDYFPDWIGRVEVELEEENGSQMQVVCSCEASLIYLVDKGCVTFHVWPCRSDKLEYPDKLVFDLDPPDDDFEVVREAAFAIRDLFDDIKISSYPMTTGSRGVHIVAPIDRNYTFDEVRAFAEDVVRLLSKKNSDLFTVENRKDKRKGRLYLDTMRNVYGQTSVAPYSVRPIDGAPVATPLEWSELRGSSLNSQSYNMGNIFRRLGKRKDPWRRIYSYAQSLDEPRKLLNSLE
jgi:bifunctional non-homologous end joining protein LigD